MSKFSTRQYHQQLRLTYVKRNVNWKNIEKCNSRPSARAKLISAGIDMVCLLNYKR